MNLLRPESGTSSYDWEHWKSRYAPHGQCGICGGFWGIHLRCWWLWLTSERVMRGATDGEQQIEPDDSYPSRWIVVWLNVRTLFSPHWWAICWRERMWPWQ